MIETVVRSERSKYLLYSAYVFPILSSALLTILEKSRRFRRFICVKVNCIASSDLVAVGPSNVVGTGGCLDKTKLKGLVPVVL